MVNNTNITFIIIIVTFIVSYKGFNDSSFLDKYSFNIDKVLIHKEYYRLISSAFLHSGWTHLIFNMVSLYSFGNYIEAFYGPFVFLLIYFGSMIGGDLLATYIHRNHGDYTAIGASGGVFGVIFASIAFFPYISMYGLPGWLFGLIYVLISIYGIKSNKDNIGHEAHLGGGLFGVFLAVICKPEIILSNYLTILCITVPIFIFLYLIITRPYLLIIDNVFGKKKDVYMNVDQKYNDQAFQKQAEIDKLLEKISKKGLDGLSKKERQTLEEYSKK